MKNIIVITGGSGFVGSNLIEYFLKKTKLQIISLDNYSSGSKKNHIINKRVQYISGHTKDIYKIFNVCEICLVSDFIYFTLLFKIWFFF